MASGKNFDAEVAKQVRALEAKSKAMGPSKDGETK
jgi:hypothetical protein